jgi:hypothetical protein
VAEASLLLPTTVATHAAQDGESKDLKISSRATPTMAINLTFSEKICPFLVFRELVDEFMLSSFSAITFLKY